MAGKPRKKTGGAAGRKRKTTGSADTPVMRQYLACKAQFPDALLMFRMGDFYEMFFEDAVIASGVLDLVLTSRDRNKENAVPMCGVPHHAMQGYLTRLIEAGHKVAICEQMEDPKKAKGIVRREVTRVVTPGVILDTEQLDAKVSNYLMALVPEGDVGLAFLDASTGEFLATRIPEGRGLADELARVRPSQVLVPQGAVEPLRAEVELLGELRVEEAGSEIFGDPADDEGLLAEAADAPADWASSAGPALRAAAAVIRYVRRILPGKELPPFRLVAYEPSNLLVLDEATLANLEIFETLMDRRRDGALIGVLDQTVTAMGGRLLRHALAFPLARVDPIVARQEAVGYLLDHARLRQDLRQALRQIHDLERLNRRVVCQLATPRDLGRLNISLRAVPGVVARLLQEAADNAVDPLPSLLGPPEDQLEDLAHRLGETLVEEPPVAAREGGIVRPGFSEALDELVALSEGGKEQILAIEARERERTGISSLRIRFNKVFGYTIEVSRAKASAVPSEYVRKQTLVNVERFITPELGEHEARVLHAEEQRVALEERLFLALRQEVAEAEARLSALASWLAGLDLLAGFAEVSARNDYCRPEMDEGDVLEVRDGRHPVVEQVVAAGRFVPNSLTLSSGEQQLVIVTGPNMAGKSTIIRQTALIALLAHTGCFVPARRARVGVLDRIFTRVGASDNLARGHSTFMVEMRETANILRYATGRSLVVLDEIGRGTSTYDGVSIAWAVAEFLHDRIRAKTLFATHFHELCSLADVKPRVHNRSVAVREYQGEVVFLHKLVSGGTSRSHGIQVGRLAGLPGEVVERATQILRHLERSADGEGGPGHGLPMLAPQLSLFGEMRGARGRATEPEPDSTDGQHPDGFASPPGSGGAEPEDSASAHANGTGARDREIAARLSARLRGVDPDALTPREAHQVVYDLVALVDEGDASPD